MTGKRYGGGDQRLREPMPFELAGIRWDDEEVHQFVAVRKVDTVLASTFMNLPESRQGQLLELVITLIGKTLDNRDGVPANWEPRELPKPADAADDWQPKFRGPDGELYPMDHREKFEQFEAGSSRRRWTALVWDAEFTVEMDALADISRDLIEASGERPTDG